MEGMVFNIQTFQLFGQIVLNLLLLGQMKHTNMNDLTTLQQRVSLLEKTIKDMQSANTIPLKLDQALVGRGFVKGNAFSINNYMTWAQITLTKSVVTTITDARIKTTSTCQVSGGSALDQNCIAVGIFNGSVTLEYGDGVGTQICNYLIIF